MSEVDLRLLPKRAGVLSWLGLGRTQGGEAASLAALAAQMRAVSPGSRADLIAGIAEFLEIHDLDACPITLNVAHDYVTGNDPLLVRLINEREVIGLEITVEWLKKLRGESKADAEANEVHRVFEKLEKHLIEFGATASAARKATQDYGSSLEGHVEQIGSVGAHLVSVPEILHMLQSVIDRTAELEEEMSRTEKQSETLRRNLEVALRSAEEDFLTGLPNRRAFEKTFENEYRSARYDNDPLVVAFCDIDHFKRINDTHGHETGDRVLKAVARNLANISSKGCYVARHGGEEFVVLFRGNTLEEARELLDNVRVELAERRLVNRLTKTPIGHVTFSAGIADVFSYPDRRSALKAADTALYLAKGRGRNQIVAAQLC